MKRIFLILALLLFPVLTHATVLHQIPECPYTGHSTCSGGIDDDNDGTIDEAAPSLAFATVTGGYAAEAEDGVLSGNAATTADASASGGDYVSLTSGARFGSGQVALCGNFTTGSYYIWPRTITPTPGDDPLGARVVWVDTSAISQNPDNTKSTALSTSDSAAYNFPTTPIATNLDFTTGEHATSQATYTLDGNTCLYFGLQDGIKLDSVFLATANSATPALPAGTPSADYVIKKIGPNTITINGACDEGAWSHADGANQVSWTGGNISNNTVNLKLLWDSAPTPKQLYWCFEVQDTDIRAAATGTDPTSPSIFSDDDLELQWKNTQSTTRDDNTKKLTVNGQSSPAIRTEQNNADLTWAPTVSVARVLTGTLNDTTADTKIVIEGKTDIGFDPGSSLLALCNFFHFDDDVAGDGQRSAFTSIGSQNDITKWGSCEFSATALGALPNPDATAPVLGTPVSPPPTLGQINATVRATVD